MRISKGMNIFGVITATLLFLANSLHAFWTYWLVREQIKTGWGFSTNIEMLALLPWALEFMSIPLMVAEVVYFVLSFFKGQHKPILVINIVLFVLLMAQYAITNLFMYY